jgi:hypothetical protein
MKTTSKKATILGLLALASGYADTVTTTDHLSVNGVLTKMSEGTITLTARFASGPKTLAIPISDVESIEFNSVAFNPGAPPKAYGLGPGVSPSGATPPKQRVVTDGIELRGGRGERQPCKVTSIDDNTVQCEATPGSKDKGRPTDYSRKIVLRILIGGGR